MSSDPALNLRILHTLDEYHEAEAAQRALWELRDDVQIVPLHVLLTAQKNGGLVVGAFEGDQMIGFLFGFLGLTKSGRLKHCSHLMCVHPDRRRSGIGERLKRFQLDYVRAQGIPLIGWTFDPLEGVNAALNIGKLRGVVRTYTRNIYGAMNDGLNAGLPSDRLEVELWVNEPSLLTPPAVRPTRIGLIEDGATVINLAEMNGLPYPTDLPTPWHQLPTTVMVEIPAEMQAIKRESLDLALRWRMNTREALEQLFTHGYVIADFIAERNPPARNFYILRRDLILPSL